MKKIDYSLVITLNLGYVKAYAVKGEQVLLVDTGYAGSADQIMQKLEKAGITEDEIGMILITHGHDDHYGSANELRDRTRAPVAIHRLDAPGMKAGNNGTLVPLGTKGKIINGAAKLRNVSNLPKVEPNMYIDETYDLENMGIPGKIIHTPGHTPGSMSVVLDNGEAIIGDLLMGGLVISGLPGYPFYATNPMQLRTSLKEVMLSSPEIIYSSHGGPFTPTMVQKYLQLTRKRR